LDSKLPGAFEDATQDVGATLTLDLPALLEWQFDEERLSTVQQPTLSVLGADSQMLSARFLEIHSALVKWIPRAEGSVLPGATHALNMQNPTDLAPALVEFWNRYTC